MTTKRTVVPTLSSWNAKEHIPIANQSDQTPAFSGGGFLLTFDDQVVYMVTCGSAWVAPDIHKSKMDQPFQA